MNKKNFENFEEVSDAELSTITGESAYSSGRSAGIFARHTFQFLLLITGVFG